MSDISQKLFEIASIDPRSSIGIAVKLLAEEQAKEERRRAGQRERTRRCEARRRENSVRLTASEDDVRLTVPIVSKKESISKKEDNRRVSVKRSTIPSDLTCSEKNVADAIKIGMSESSIPLEWSNFRDHHLHKGTLGKDWDAGWRRWCSNHVKWSKPTAKPLSPALQVQLHNRKLAHEYDADCLIQPGTEEISSPLGLPATGIVPSNGHTHSARNAGSHGYFAPKLL